MRRLVLIAPLGVFDAADPVTDVFALRPGQASGVLRVDPERFRAAAMGAEGDDPSEMQALQARTNEAAARLLWPVLGTRLAARLPRLEQPVLLLWGEGDRVVPFSYAARFAQAIAGETTVRKVPCAGHLAELDAPEAVAEAVLSFLGS